MLESVLTARLLLAAVFGIAGGAKLVDLTGSRDALQQFGVRDRLVRPLCLPFAELGVAIGLLANASARWAGAGALVLLGVFATGIGLNLVRGKRPDCHCFGQLHSIPIGRSTLPRNGVLAGAAGLIVWQGPGLDAGLWLAGLPALARLTGVVATVLIGLIVVEGWFLLSEVDPMWSMRCARGPSAPRISAASTRNCAAQVVEGSTIATSTTVCPITGVIVLECVCVTGLRTSSL